MPPSIFNISHNRAVTAAHTARAYRMQLSVYHYFFVIFVI